jgi:hypothetical protein
MKSLTTELKKYSDGFDQRIIEHRLRKHGPTRNNKTTVLCNLFLGSGAVNTLHIELLYNRFKIYAPIHSSFAQVIYPLCIFYDTLLPQRCEIYYKQVSQQVAVIFAIQCFSLSILHKVYIFLLHCSVSVLGFYRRILHATKRAQVRFPHILHETALIAL